MTVKDKFKKVDENDKLRIAPKGDNRNYDEIGKVVTFLIIFILILVLCRP